MTTRRLLMPITMAALTLALGALAAGRLARLNVEETQLSGEQSRNIGQLAQLLSILEELKR